MLIIEGLSCPSGCDKCRFRSNGAPPDRDCGGVPQGCGLTGVKFFDNYQMKPVYPKRRPGCCPLREVKGLSVVTSGEYSDYHIEKIFSDRVKAHMYSLLDPDRRVEEYMMDDVDFKDNRSYLLVSYDYKWNTIELTLRGKPLKPRISKEWGRHFEFTIPLSDERVYKNLCRYGKNSKVVFKIAQDEFAQYCYEHNTTKDGLIRKHEEEYRKKSTGYYSLATTSSSFDNSAYRQRLVVNERVATALKQMIVDGKPLPPVEELQTIYDVTASEVEKEHGDRECEDNKSQHYDG